MIFIGIGFLIFAVMMIGLCAANSGVSDDYEDVFMKDEED